jgi:hypothetical protein
MAKNHSRDNPYSGLSEKVASLERSTLRIERALWGEDMRGGMVRDVADIKASLRLWGQLKTFGLGIASTVIATLIIAVLLGAL